MIQSMGTCLKTFHDNKDIVIELDIREHFNIPKVHTLIHYVDCIKSFGSADGYNTESPERIHIDFAKEAYHASNKRDYVEQMAMWLQRHEAMWLRESFLIWVGKRLESLMKTTDVNTMDEDEEDAQVELEHVEVTQRDINITHVGDTRDKLNLNNIRYSLAKSPPHQNLTIEKLGKFWHQQLSHCFILISSS
jgi:hypothetical protein